MKTFLTLTAAIFAFAMTTPAADAAPRPHQHGKTTVLAHAHGKKHHQPARRLEGYTRSGKAVYSVRKVVGYDRYKRPIYRWVKSSRDRVVYKTYKEYQRSRKAPHRHSHRR